MDIDKKKVIAFVHIPKAAGSTITHIFRSTFGLSHCRAISKNEIYTKKDLQLDRKLYPFLKAISGHQLRPHIDFGDYEKELFWFVMLRDPVERFVSQYKWWLKMNNSDLDFNQWCALKGKKFANFQVRWLAGEENSDKAIAILANKMDCVGTQSHFNDSLKMLHFRSGVASLPTRIEKRINSANKQDDRFTIEQAYEYNQHDLKLYQFFLKNIWTEQKREIEEFQSDFIFKDNYFGTINRNLNLAYHGLVYKSLKSLT